MPKARAISKTAGSKWFGLDLDIPEGEFDEAVARLDRLEADRCTA